MHKILGLDSKVVVDKTFVCYVGATYRTPFITWQRFLAPAGGETHINMSDVVEIYDQHEMKSFGHWHVKTLARNNKIDSATEGAIPL